MKAYQIILGLMPIFPSCAMLCQQPLLVWTADLSTNASYHRYLLKSTAQSRLPKLAFSSDRKLMVAFDDAPSPEPAPTLKPFGFHILSVDSNSGAFGKELSLSVLNSTSDVEPLGNDDIVVMSGEDLRKYDEDFNQLSSLAIPLRNHGQPTEENIGQSISWNTRYETWQMSVSPTGKTILLGHTIKPMQLELRWLRTSDMSEFQSMHSHTWKQFQAGDDTVLFVDPMRSIIASPHFEKDLCQQCFGAYYITDDLFLTYDNKHFYIRDVAGKELKRGDVASGISLFSRAMHSTLFAFGSGAYRSYGFPIKTHIAGAYADVYVIDWKSLKTIAEVHLEKQSVASPRTAIALSPDGHKLAILEGPSLRCYVLP